MNVPEQETDTCCTLPESCLQLLEAHVHPELFKALCDPKRLALLCRLAVASEPQTVTDAASCCGVHISGVSRHLAMLREVGAVKASKIGREVRYTLDFDALIGTLRGFADALEKCREICGEENKHEC